MYVRLLIAEATRFVTVLPTSREVVPRPLADLGGALGVVAASSRGRTVLGWNAANLSGSVLPPKRGREVKIVHRGSALNPAAYPRSRGGRRGMGIALAGLRCPCLAIPLAGHLWRGRWWRIRSWGNRRLANSPGRLEECGFPVRPSHTLSPTDNTEPPRNHLGRPRWNHLHGVSTAWSRSWSPTQMALKNSTAHGTCDPARSGPGGNKSCPRGQYEV